MPHRLYHTLQDNMFAKVALLALLATTVSADKLPQQSYQQPERTYRQPEQTYQEPERTYEPQPSYTQSRPSYKSEENQEGMPFNYQWQVEDQYSGNVFNHGSKSDGKVTEGEYRVLLP